TSKSWSDAPTSWLPLGRWRGRPGPEADLPPGPGIPPGPLPSNQYKKGARAVKVCLIGSTRFREEFVEVNQELTRRGHLVYSVAFYKEPTKVDEHTKEVLDLVHLQKISESDVVVLITDKEGYIGDSTRRGV